jgi:hypothetical protein
MLVSLYLGIFCRTAKQVSSLMVPDWSWSSAVCRFLQSSTPFLCWCPPPCQFMEIHWRPIRSPTGIVCRQVIARLAGGPTHSHVGTDFLIRSRLSVFFRFRVQAVTALVSAVLSFVVVAAAWDVGDQASSRAGAPVLDCHGFFFWFCPDHDCLSEGLACHKCCVLLAGLTILGLMSNDSDWAL